MKLADLRRQYRLGREDASAGTVPYEGKCGSCYHFLPRTDEAEAWCDLKDEETGPAVPKGDSPVMTCELCDPLNSFRNPADTGCPNFKRKSGTSCEDCRHFEPGSEEEIDWCTKKRIANPEEHSDDDPCDDFAEPRVCQDCAKMRRAHHGRRTWWECADTGGNTKPHKDASGCSAFVAK